MDSEIEEEEIEEKNEFSAEGDFLAESMKTDRHNIPIHSPNTKSNIDLPESLSALTGGGFFNNLYKASFQGSVPDVHPLINEEANELIRK